MQKNKWGRIINVTSVSVKEPLNYLVLSNSIRSAVVAWAKSLSVDIGKDGITINSILTGYFDTERIKELNKEKSKSLNISEDEVLEKMIKSKILNKNYGAFRTIKKKYDIIEIAKKFDMEFK